MLLILLALPTVDLPTSTKLWSPMRKCPYCAEEIAADTVRCPFCDSDVRVQPGPPVGATPPSSPADPPVVGEGALRFSHSGGRHLLGFGPDYFGIWDRQLPGGPI